MQIKRNWDTFIPRMLFFTVIYFQIAFHDTSSVWSLCCSWGVIDPILKQLKFCIFLAATEASAEVLAQGTVWVQTLKVLEVHCCKMEEYFVQVQRSVFHMEEGKNFSGKGKNRFQASLPLCHLLTSEIVPLNHAVSITLQERWLLIAVSVSLPSFLGCFQNRDLGSPVCLLSYRFTSDHIMFLISKYKQ